MKRSAIVFCSALALISAPALSASSADVQKNMTKAAKQVISAYKTGGVAGMVTVAENCYKALDTKMFYCAYVDLAGRHADSQIAASMGFPVSPFFSNDQFGPRISPLFSKAGMNTNGANEYLQAVTPQINKLVEAEMSR